MKSDDHFGGMILFAMALFVAFAIGVYAGHIDHEKLRERLQECQAEIQK